LSEKGRMGLLVALVLHMRELRLEMKRDIPITDKEMEEPGFKLSLPNCRSQVTFFISWRKFQLFPRQCWFNVI
jgi:hypothetical protein